MDADHLSSNVRFSYLWQKILKLSSPVLWKVFEIKSHQRRAHYLNPLRNGEQLAARGGWLPEPPPSLIRVKQISILKIQKGIKIWAKKVICNSDKSENLYNIQMRAPKTATYYMSPIEIGLL